MIFRRHDVLRHLNQQPFRPFRVHMSGGRVYEVRHPELAMVSPSFVLIGLTRQEGSPLRAIDDFVEIALMHITEIEPVAGGAPPAEASGGEPVPAA